MEIALGNLVLSKAGRDKKKAFLIISILDSQYVLIADGVLRKIDKPKKKKVKHLAITKTIFQEIQTKLKANVKINDAEIQKALEVIQRNL